MVKHRFVLLVVTLLLLLAACGDVPTEVASTQEPTSKATSMLMSTPIPSPTPTPTLGIGSTMIREKDGAVMVYVPAGEFTMGSLESSLERDADDDEFPQHTVYVDAFWIGAPVKGACYSGA